MKTTAVSPIVVTGFHGSGHSLAAAFLAGLGVDMGGQPGGDVETESPRSLQREMVSLPQWTSEGPPLDPGELLELKPDLESLDRWRARASEILRTNAARAPWGWEDPLAALSLDFWVELAPTARFVLVYGSPWDFLTSLARTTRNPRLGQDTLLRLWLEYNERLLDFSDRHRDRCVILEGAALADRAGDAAEILGSGLELDFPRLRSIDDGDRRAFARVLAARLVRPEEIHRVRDESPQASQDPALVEASEHLLESLASRSDLTAAEPDVDAAIRGLRPPAPTSSPPRVAVVVTSHDDGRYLPDALASVQLCREDPLELVIVDDGSTDPFTCDLLTRLAGEGFRVLRLEHRSLAAARNSGIQATTAPFVLPLDADNLIRPGYATKALEIHDADDSVGVVYADAMRFGLRQGRWTIGAFSLDRVALENYIDACSVVRRTAWESCGGFDEQLPGPTYEDWELWLAMAERSWNFFYLAEPFFDYRSRKGSLLSRTEPVEVQKRLWIHIVNKHAALYQPPRLGLLSVKNFEEVRAAWRARDVAAEHAESWRDRAVARDEELASIKPVLAARDEELASIKPVLAARDEELASIKPHLAAQEQELAALRSALAAREEELASLRARLDPRAGGLRSTRPGLTARLLTRISGSPPRRPDR